jgi:hypothetical protein
MEYSFENHATNFLHYLKGEVHYLGEKMKRQVAEGKPLRAKFLRTFDEYYSRVVKERQYLTKNNNDKYVFITMYTGGRILYEEHKIAWRWISTYLEIRSYGEWIAYPNKEVELRTFLSE